MKNTLLTYLGVGLLAFLLGWYPQYTKRSQAESELNATSVKLQHTSQSLELSQFQNRAGMLWDQVERADYGAAGEVASKLFTELRTFANSLPAGDLRQGLERSLGNRDAITASLARADTSAKGLVRDLFRNFPQQ